MSASSAAVWFRKDLRVHDHAPLRAALARGDVTCVYCLDPRSLEATPRLGVPRMGAHRARFFLESLACLRQELRRLGGDLVVRSGRPEDVLPALAVELGWTKLDYHALVGTEEQAVERAVATALDEVGCRATAHWDLTLVDLPDLPFEIAATPEVFTRFRKAVEKLDRLTPPLAAPTALPEPRLGKLDPGDIPSLFDLGIEDAPGDERAVLDFQGGEAAGKARVAQYFWESDGIRRYKETRNGMVGADYSSKLSPWLAQGCLSPRWVQAEVERYEEERVRNQSTYWMTFELLWRDYFQLIAAKHGRRLFRASGLRGVDIPWRRDDELFDCWRTGRTGFPLVDANMRELLATGFMSNRGRQIVASFLTKNLGLDWRLGAEWFESQLIDSDVASNYGNWNYGAGVGNDARGFRYFDIPTQAKKYDRRGSYARLWCPELKKLDDRRIHEPWKLTRKEQERLGLLIGRDYPAPIVDLAQSVEEQRGAWEAATSG